MELTNVIYLYEVYVKLKVSFFLFMTLSGISVSRQAKLFFEHNSSAFL